MTLNDNVNRWIKEIGESLRENKDINHMDSIRTLTQVYVYLQKVRYYLEG